MVHLLSNSIIYIWTEIQIQFTKVSKKLDFLKSGQLITGLTKAFLGVGDNQKELCFSDHTHNLPDLSGILTANKGGTGVSSLDDLKNTLGLPNTQPVYVTQAVDGVFNFPAGAIGYIIFGPDGGSNRMYVEIGSIGSRAVLICTNNYNNSKVYGESCNFSVTNTKWWTTMSFPTNSHGVFFYI